ncbi:Flp pilus assembly complex ATPase component TadA [Akkermansiaceae bacterium]|nr:Flp pilus assembly complex ATPase component TadA [Akkermansiaceae bacterium]
MDDALQQLIRDAFRDKATDVFLIEAEPPRIRREGKVIELHPGPVPHVVMRDFWNECGADPGLEKEADISWQLPEGKRLRVNLYHTLGRLAAVMRPIRDDIPDLTNLAMPADLLQSWMRRANGLILVTGPTGSGKSTTVAACLNWVNRNQARHIVTLEDPIEFLFENEESLFSQREVRLDSENFSSGLRAAMRQSPDVLFIGEIRDAETALTALHASETGHLVISTMHSGGVVETIDRFTHLLGSGVEGGMHLLSKQLVGVISQQLLPKYGGGLFPALEYFQNEAASRRWIAEKRLADLQDHINKSDGTVNCSALDYLVASVKQNYLELEVARDACPRPQDLDRAMRGIS